MASRSFERTTFGNTFGQRAVPGYQITCSECGAVEKITANTFGGSMAPEGIAQRFRNKGWKISTKGNRDICPACAGNQASHHNKPEPAIEQTSNIVSINSAMTKAPITEIEQPREMTRADRRVIFAKLEDVYIDEKHGYDAGWGDARVAKDLGVPQDWVRQIREENFGVENSNPEADALLRQARGILDEAKQALADHEHAMQAALKSGDDKRKKLAADVARIEIRLNEMLKIIGR